MATESVLTSRPNYGSLRESVRAGDGDGENSTEGSLVDLGSGDPVDDDLEDHLPVSTKIAYGVGGPPMQMLSNCMGFFLAVFLLETAGVNAYYNSVIQFSARAWDAITDPIVGYLVTRTRTRFGRMRPWLIISAPFGCLAFFFLFYVPDFASTEAKFAYYFFMVLCLQTALTTFHVPYSSMTMVLTSSMKQRDSLSGFRMGFELCGVLIGVGVFGSIINMHRVANVACGENVTISDGDRQLEKNDYMLGSGVICAVFLCCAVTVFFGTREKNVIVERKENYLRSLKRIITFQPYLRLMFAFLFCSLGLQIVQGNLALYITHSMELPGHMNYGILVLLVTSICVVPIGQKIITSFGKKTAFAVGIINILPILIVTVFVPPKPHLALFYGVMVWAGFTVSIAFLLPWSMLPDVIDDFMLRNGVRKEAAFYSLYVFFNKFAVGFSIALSSVVLGLVGYKENELCQEPAVGLALRYLVGPAALICFVLSLAFLYSYPINEKYRSKMREEMCKLSVERDTLVKSTTLVSTLMEVPSTMDMAPIHDEMQPTPSNGRTPVFSIGGSSNVLL